MSRADELYKATCRDILENGFSDENLEVRPHWADGTSAHTVKKFGVVNRYNLAEEFPIMTLRRTYWKSAVDELPEKVQPHCGPGQPRLGRMGRPRRNHRQGLWLSAWDQASVQGGTL